MPRISTASSRVSRSLRSPRNTRNGPSPLQIRMSALWCEARWIFVAALAAWLTLVLVTWHPLDPGWSHAVSRHVIHNKGGVLGAYLADILLYLFGFSAWWWVILLWYRVGVGYRRLTACLRGAIGSKVERATEGGGEEPLLRVRWAQGLGFILLLIGSVGLEALRLYSHGGHLPATVSAGNGAGGVLGHLLARQLPSSIGFTGSTLVCLVCAAIGLSLFFSFSWLKIAEWVGAFIENVMGRLHQALEAHRDRKLGARAKAARIEQVVAKQGKLEHEPVRIEPPVRVESAMAVIAKPDRVKRLAPSKSLSTPPIIDGDLPTISLLDPTPASQEMISEQTMAFTSRLIEKKLADFGVSVVVVAAQAGPVITRYEIEPATGVKGSQIVNLAKDLARALSLVSIRVVETIPGKNLMGLELPNPRRQVVRLAEILGSQTYYDSASVLSLALGKDIAGHSVVADLMKMPHLLVAGTTGSGKSVGINAMILSLLYKADASHIRLILIDPKMLEMSVYEGIPHLLAPVVTDMRQAANALNWCIGEMERRYRLMSKLGVRNLAAFNNKLREGMARGETMPNPFSLTPDEPEPLQPLPTIVVVIDELADLMMVVGKKIEELIARLAQKARASGIHLILATQRPSVDVITGLIKANIPTRIAFQVSSKVDSRTILDQMGAEALLGQGDMIYLPPGSGLPVRVHGAFVSDDEVHRVVAYLKAQGTPDYIEGLLEGSSGETGDGVGSVTGLVDNESDPMYDQACAVVLKHRRASISLVQRHLRIGYNRAARLLEQMEKAGMVSTMQSNGNREILVPAVN